MTLLRVRHPAMKPQIRVRFGSTNMAALSCEPKIRARWRSFWAKQVTPQHREGTSDHYSRYAKELTLLFPPERVG
jgi:hypothetical protein